MVFAFIFIYINFYSVLFLPSFFSFFGIFVLYNFYVLLILFVLSLLPALSSSFFFSFHFFPFIHRIFCLRLNTIFPQYFFFLPSLQSFSFSIFFLSHGIRFFSFFLRNISQSILTSFLPSLLLFSPPSYILSLISLFISL